MDARKRLCTLFVVLFVQPFVGCAPDDFKSINDTSSFLDTPAERDGPINEDYAHRSINSIAGTYHMPVGSGEEYTVSTYAGHGYAWDFNRTYNTSECGEPVMAAADGVVTTINTSCVSTSGTTCGGGWGNYVKIDHDDDTFFSRYAHLTTVYVVTGQWVRQGQVLGTIGTTGNSTGCHLHFQVEDSSGNDYRMYLYYYDTASTSRRSKEFVNNESKISYNAGIFEDTRDSNGGTGVVGTSDPKVATRPDADGFSKSYVGGSLGDTTIYYEALGFSGSYNNTNQSWLLQGAMRTYYYSCGGPAYCFLGYPTGARVAYGTGWKQTFRCGYLLESSSGVVTAYSYTCG